MTTKGGSDRPMAWSRFDLSLRLGVWEARRAGPQSREAPYALLIESWGDPRFLGVASLGMGQLSLKDH